MDWHSRIAYPPVIPLLDRLLAGARSVLSEDLLGLYLSGSLAGGDFVPGRSDVDFIAVTREILPPDRLPALAAMHRAITASGLPEAGHLEGLYVPRQALRRHDPGSAGYPALRADGSFAVDRQASDWVIQLHLLRERAMPLFGPPPRDLVDPVAPGELRRAALGILREWWEPMLVDPTRIQPPEYQVYAVLTMCRSLYTHRHADVVSKAAAAAWARDELGQPWAGLVDHALHWREGQPFDRLDEVLALIRETLRRWQAGAA